MSDAGFLLQNKFPVFIWWSGNSDHVFDNGSEELLAVMNENMAAHFHVEWSCLLVKHCEFTLFPKMAWVNIPSGKICHNEPVFVPALPRETGRSRSWTCSLPRGSFAVSSRVFRWCPVFPCSSFLWSHPAPSWGVAPAEPTSTPLSRSWTRGDGSATCAIGSMMVWTREGKMGIYWKSCCQSNTAGHPRVFQANHISLDSNSIEWQNFF